jgi:hypothetical protein
MKWEGGCYFLHKKKRKKMREEKRRGLLTGYN